MDSPGHVQVALCKAPRKEVQGRGRGRGRSRWVLSRHAHPHGSNSVFSAVNSSHISHHRESRTLPSIVLIAPVLQIHVIPGQHADLAHKTNEIRNYRFLDSMISNVLARTFRPNQTVACGEAVRDDGLSDSNRALRVFSLVYDRKKDWGLSAPKATSGQSPRTLQH